jgi:hypothetical protein
VGDTCSPLLCDEGLDACIPATRIANIELFYSGRFGDAADLSYDFLAPGSTATTANMTTYTHGITGIRVIFDELVTFATTPAAAFTFEWTTLTGTTFSPVTDAATAITVTATPQGGVTEVTIVLDDDHGELSGNPVALPSGDSVPTGDAVFIIGNLSGDVDGDGRILVTDAGAIRQEVNPFLLVPITNIFDVDKDGRVLVTDAGEARVDVNPFFVLPLISP